MKKIEIISASVRDGRMSHRGALFLERFIRENQLGEPHILDLKEYNFPLFTERYHLIKETPVGMDDFAARIMAADGVILVTPVYNSSYAAALKNAIDILYKEWIHKPVAIYSATYTAVPGIAAVQELQKLMLKLGCVVAPVLGTFINIAVEMDENGVPANSDKFIKIMRPPLDELCWLMEKTQGAQ